LLFFDRLESAAHGSQLVSRMGVSACDLMDRRLLSIARENDVHYELLIPRDTEALLLVEVQDDDPAVVRDRLQQVVRQLLRRKGLAFHAQVALERDDVDLYWRLARHVVPTLYRLRGSIRPLPFVEDIAIPPERLPEFVVRMQNVLKTHQVTASFFAHAGHGQLHLRPFLDLANPQDVQTMQPLAIDLYEQVWDVGGTISGEHGDGLSRTWFVERQYGPLYRVFQELKRIFDPQNILNPGKKVASRPQPVTGNLRPVQVSVPPTSDPSPASLEAAVSQPFPLQLAWRDPDITYSARSCNGCGACRTQQPEDRMCPMLRFAPREEASPRAKANLVRGVLTGRLDANSVSSDAFKEIADLCFNCHQCRLECPAGVDIPKLMVESKGQYVARNGLTLSDWFMTRLDLLSSWGSWAAPLTNWSLGNPQMRWLLERVTGIAQGRKLPRLAARSFLRMAHRKRLTRPARHRGRKVLYFLDLYANWYDVQLAEAVVRVLQHNGVSVYVPPHQLPSGMPQVALGALDDARRMAAKNVAMLAEAVRQGYHVVTSEPAAALCLTHEYPQLLDDEDARLVASNTSEASTFLWRMHQQGQLELDLKPVNIDLGYHLPCHLRALGVGSPGENLLRLVPGVSVHSLDAGCSGMAGTFGLKRENYRNSLRAGWGVISALRSPTIQVGASECSACKMQMEQGNAKPTLHPLKVLALAYGLMPEVAELLTARGEDRMVT
jgi:Fe-S oxidoreductase